MKRGFLSFVVIWLITIVVLTIGSSAVAGAIWGVGYLAEKYGMWVMIIPILFALTLVVAKMIYDDTIQ